MVVCVVDVVLIIELVVICCCCDCVVHGEICGIFESCGREQDGGCIVVLVAMYMMRMLCLLLLIF